MNVARKQNDPDNDHARRIIAALVEAIALEYPAPVGNDNIAVIRARLYLDGTTG